MYVSGEKVHLATSPFVKVRYLNRLLAYRGQFQKRLLANGTLAQRDALADEHLKKLIWHLDDFIKSEVVI
jgi:hypothetical protein